MLSLQIVVMALAVPALHCGEKCEKSHEFIGQSELPRCCFLPFCKESETADFSIPLMSNRVLLFFRQKDGNRLEEMKFCDKVQLCLMFGPICDTVDEM